MANPKEIDAEVVERLASIQCTMNEIAAVVKCSVDTLERRFADVIKRGKDNGKASLRRMQWEAAQKGNTIMLIFLGKNLLNQADKFTMDNPSDFGFDFVLPPAKAQLPKAVN